MKKEQNLWAAFLPFLLADVLITMLLMLSSAATPYITEAYGLTSQQAPWMNTLYTMSAAVLAPLMGWYGDKFGMKKQVTVGILASILANVICAVSPNYVLFCVGRFFAGFGLASAYPAALSFITDHFPVDKKVGTFAILGACINVGSGSGPAIAGLLLEIFNWREIFMYGNIILIVLLVYISIVVKNEVPQNAGPRKIDGKGMALLFVGVGALLALLSLSSVYGWTSPFILSLMAVSFIALLFFVRHENRTPVPLMDLKLLKNKYFLIPAGTALLLYGVKGYCSVAVPYYFLMGLGTSSTVSGLWLSLFFMAGFPLSFFVGKLNKKFTTRTLAVFSVLTWAFCILAFCATEFGIPIVYLFIAGIIGSFGVAILSGVSNSSALERIPAEKSGAASGTLSLLSNLGSAMISALIVPYLGVIGSASDGTPNYLVSFPRVGMIMLIPVTIGLVLAFMYPKEKIK